MRSFDEDHEDSGFDLYLTNYLVLTPLPKFSNRAQAQEYEYKFTDDLKAAVERASESGGKVYDLPPYEAQFRNEREMKSYCHYAIQDGLAKEISSASKEVVFPG